MFKRISTLCLILLASSVLAGADAKDYKIESGKLEGSLYKIAIPVKWNKKLLLNAHGGRPETIPISADFKIEGTQNEKLLKEGWMIAETSYRRNGIFVNDGVEDLKILYDFIVKNHGKPEKTYIAGVSMGGKIVVKIAEEPKMRFDGIIAHCAALLCEDNDPSMCEDKENLKKLTFKPNIPILFYSNINELEYVKEYISKAESTKNTALWTSPRRGHCNTNYTEALKAVKAISEWVENGRKPADETVLINVIRTDSLARHEKNGIFAKVKSINVYGSLVVDVSRIDLEKANIKQDSHFQVTFKDKKFKPLLGHGYGDVAEKEWIGFITAEDYLMVAINWENAQKQLGCKEGDEIFIEKIMDKTTE
ncbi:MAG TPA: SAM-dependent chlorinase/fluorinase [bacterium]|nr:SAM-dependent chlorinase/fluorinase [bacterium]HQN72243.1 SAM-dependent chlorinase/fluorinase [bacterium]